MFVFEAQSGGTQRQAPQKYIENLAKFTKVQTCLQHSMLDKILSLLPIFRHRCNCSFTRVGSYHMLDGMTGKRLLKKHPSKSLCSLGNTACAVPIAQATVRTALVESWIVIGDR